MATVKDTPKMIEHNRLEDMPICTFCYETMSSGAWTIWSMNVIMVLSNRFAI